MSEYRHELDAVCVTKNYVNVNASAVRYMDGTARIENRETLPEIKPCPCGALAYHAADTYGAREHFVFCTTCHRIGPVHTDGLIAVNLWNNEVTP